jgi:hypothetical protein
MADKTTTLVRFEYSDGSAEYAKGDHAQEVMDWLNAAQSMLCVHGGNYTGRRMVEVPAPDVVPPPAMDQEAMTMGLDADRTTGKSLWHQECDESGRLNRR